MKRFQILTAAFCAAVLLCGLSTTAYAGGGEEWEGLDPAEPAATEEPAEPTVTPGEGFSEEGNLVTRDLLYDEHTNKQFITVQARGGATFYLVIDYDKPVDEEGEQYETYFLNMVDEADLLAAAEAAGGGAVNTDCPVCSVNMGKCVGAEPEPVADPVEEPEPEPEKKGNAGMLLIILALAVIGGGAGWYFKICRPKQEKAAGPEEDYGDELEDYDGGDDMPPWDEDEPEEMEDEE